MKYFFLDWLKKIHKKFPNAICSWIRQNNIIDQKMYYNILLTINKSLIMLCLPTASPEFMVHEGCWNIVKDDPLVPALFIIYRFQKNIYIFLEQKAIILI
ncbi:MAG TPA: hypothetical protein VJ767_00790 [Nitrososphaeraceae archaeon]|nr:hypothetical protein [Nitrososphaeraceae archaeon]